MFIVVARIKQNDNVEILFIEEIDHTIIDVLEIRAAYYSNASNVKILRIILSDVARIKQLETKFRCKLQKLAGISRHISLSRNNKSVNKMLFTNSLVTNKDENMRIIMRTSININKNGLYQLHLCFRELKNIGINVEPFSLAKFNKDAR